MAPRSERLQGNLLLLQLRGLPGAPGRHPLQERKEIGVCPHAERQRPRRWTHLGGNRRKLPAKGRERRRTGGAPSVFERRGDPPAIPLTRTAADSSGCSRRENR